MTRDDGQRAARWLLAVVTFLIVYGSLYPFRFAATETQGILALVSGLPWARWWGFSWAWSACSSCRWWALLRLPVEQRPWKHGPLRTLGLYGLLAWMPR